MSNYLSISERRKNGKLILYRSNSKEEQISHFMERLEERYELTMTRQEYDELCNPHGIFHGVFPKQRSKTLGWIEFKQTKIWVLRDGETGLLCTCYPPSIEYSNMEMLRSCFSGTLRKIAFQIYKSYISESVKISKIEFNSVKEAAIYFFTKTKFAPLHINKFKNGSVKTHKIASFIKNVITGQSEYISLQVRKKPNKKRGK